VDRSLGFGGEIDTRTGRGGYQESLGARTQNGRKGQGLKRGEGAPTGAKEKQETIERLRCTKEGIRLQSSKGGSKTVVHGITLDGHKGEFTFIEGTPAWQIRGGKWGGGSCFVTRAKRKKLSEWKGGTDCGKDNDQHKKKRGDSRLIPRDAQAERRRLS